MLSRAYIQSTTKEDLRYDDIECINMIIQSETENDEYLQTLKSEILDGWPETKNDLEIELHPYFPQRDELTVQNGHIFKGDRMIIPHKLRPEIKNKIHSSHLGWKDVFVELVSAFFGLQ